MQYVNGYNKGETRYPETAKNQFQEIYFEAIYYFLVPLKEKFDQPKYIIYAAIESLLLSITNSKRSDQNGMKMIQENYSHKVDILSLDVEMSILKELFKDAPVVFFPDFIAKLQLLPDERQLIPNIIVLYNLLLINSATIAAQERSFSLCRRMKTW